MSLTYQQPAAQSVTVEHSPRTLAWCALGGGLALSLAGNIAHATPHHGRAVVGAVLPFVVALCVELVVRWPWPRTALWACARYGIVSAVGGVTLYVSYVHLRLLLIEWGEDSLTASLLAAIPDLLGLVGALALFAAESVPPPPPVAVLDHTDYTSLSKAEAITTATRYVGDSPTAVSAYLKTKGVPVSKPWVSRVLTDNRAA